MNHNLLKQRYEKKRLVEIKVKLKKIDEILIKDNVHREVSLLLEALDENEYKEATAVIDKLQKLKDIAKGASMTVLPRAIDIIVKEINNFTGGSGISRFKGSISSLFSKAPAKNPILAGLALAGALEAGFKILPAILKNNIPDIEKDQEKQKKPLGELIEEEDDVDKKLKKNIETNLIKAFVPSGTFGKIFGKLPGLDAAKLVEELFLATPLQLNEFSKTLMVGVTVSDIDPNLAVPEKAGTGTDTKANEKQSPADKKQNVTIIQTAAKKAGISDGKALLNLFSKLGPGYEAGSDASTLVLSELQALQNTYQIDADQTEGFIRGLVVDFKQFKKEIDTKIKAALEKKNKEEKSKKPAASGESTSAAAEVAK